MAIQKEFLMLLDRLVEALEENNRLLQISVNQRLGSEERNPVPPQPKKKPKHYIRKTPVKYDTGKIMALFNAGWTYAKIAEEIGCSHSYVGKVVMQNVKG